MQKIKHAETLFIDGMDAAAFAHAQFSSNVIALATGQWQFSAWLDPQGRVKFFFHLVRLADDQFLLILRGGSADRMIESLRRFVFRSKVKLSLHETRALSTGPAMPLHTVQTNAGDLLLGCNNHSLRIASDRLIDAQNFADTISNDDGDAWRLLQLRSGWPWLPDVLLNELLPQALSLQRLQAIVIDKGCYPGQEIVARIHFRGGSKKHLHRVVVSHAKSHTLAFSGETLRLGGNEKGCLIDALDGGAGIEALAVLNDDIVAHANIGEMISLDEGIAIRLCETWRA